MTQIHFEETEYGFEYGSASITRIHSDQKDGWVIVGLETPKHKNIQIYVTKTGKVRILDGDGEWQKPPKKVKPTPPPGRVLREGENPKKVKK